MIGSARGVRVHPLAQESQVLQFVAVEVTGDVDAFTSHNYNFVAQQYLLRHNSGQPAEEVASAIDYQNLMEPVRHGVCINETVCLGEKGYRF